MNALREWLVEKTLPVWLARGIDHDCGGFHEKLAFDLTPVVDEGKRAMVQARQCYVFAGPGAHLSGASAAAKGGFEFLRATEDGGIGRNAMAHRLTIPENCMIRRSSYSQPPR